MSPAHLCIDSPLETASVGCLKNSFPPLALALAKFYTSLVLLGTFNADQTLPLLQCNCTADRR